MSTERCLVCEGICPYCAYPIGDAAGSMEYVLCSACHAVYSHLEWHEGNQSSA